MFRSEAITIIKRGLGFRQTQDAAIVAALKEAQRDLELGQTLPNWLLVFDEAVVTTVGVATVALPTGFLRFHEDYPLYVIDDEGRRVSVPRKQQVEARDAYGSVTDGATRVFVQDTKARLTLLPTPTTVYSLYVTYYKAAVVLDSEVENLWLKNAPNYLVGMAGLKVAADLRDKAGVERFSKMAQIGNKGFLGDVVEDELAGRPLLMGRNN